MAKIQRMVTIGLEDIIGFERNIKIDDDYAINFKFKVENNCFEPYIKVYKNKKIISESGKSKLPKEILKQLDGQLLLDLNILESSFYFIRLSCFCIEEKIITKYQLIKFDNIKVDIYNLGNSVDSVISTFNSIALHNNNNCYETMDTELLKYNIEFMDSYLTDRFILNNNKKRKKNYKHYEKF